MDMTHIQSLLFWNVNTAEKRLVAELSHHAAAEKLNLLHVLPREGEGGSMVQRKKW